MDLSVNHLPKLVWSTMSRWSSTVVKALWHRPASLRSEYLTFIGSLERKLIYARLTSLHYKYITHLYKYFMHICMYKYISVLLGGKLREVLCLPSSKPSPVLIWMTSHIQKETDWIYLKAIGKFHSLGHLLWFINCPGSDMDDLRHLLDQEHAGSWLAFPKNPTYPIQPNQGLNTRWTQRAW